LGLKNAHICIKNSLKEHFSQKYQERPFIDKAIDFLEENKSCVITAPTGYGKTALSLTISLNELKNGYKLILSYPLRTLIEKQERVFKRYFGDKVGVRYMGKSESPYFVHPITLTTIDTLSLTALGISPEDTQKVFKEALGVGGSLGHYMFSWASVYTSSMIFDEVHLLYDSYKSLSFLLALIKLQKEIFENRIVLMSATMPSKFLEMFRKLGLSILNFEENDDEGFSKERKDKEYTIDICKISANNKYDFIRTKLNDYKRALIIFNTIKDAVQFYKKFFYGRKDAVLLHSRFTLEDRKRKAEELDNASIIISTQAIEAGIDISSDLLITELAPPNSLVQRFGRFLRHQEKKGKAFIWYEVDENGEPNGKGVYSKDLLTRTLNYLENKKDNINLHLNYQDFLDKVYIDELFGEHSFVFVDEIIEKVTNIIDPTPWSLDFLIQNEGSLVRDSSLFLLYTKDGVEVPVDFTFLKRYCSKAISKKGLEKDPPKNEKQAFLMTLEGYNFVTTLSYDKEVGLVEEYI